MLLTACASPREKYIVASDSCSNIREPFVQILERQQAQVSKWAAAGAAAGAATGVAAGLAADQSLGGALIGLLGGAIMGGAAGAAMGYYANLEERGLQTSALRNAVYTDAGRDVRSSDRFVESVQKLNECRLLAVQQVAADIRSGAIDTATARIRLDRIKANVASDNELIDSALEGLDKRSAIYVDAMARAGVQNTEAFLASTKSYEPTVRAASYTVGRAPTAERVNTTANVREKPGTQFRILTTLRTGTQVEVISRENGWALVDYGPDQGYVAERLIGGRNARAGSSNTLTGIRLDDADRPNTDNEIEELAVRRAELAAVGKAHVSSVQQSIADTEALLL